MKGFGLRKNRVNEGLQKAEIIRTRLTYGKSNLKIDMDLETPPSSLLTVKILFNSVNTRSIFRAIIIKTSKYPNTPLERPEFISVKIAKGMYGLRHAVNIVEKLL